MVLLLAGCTLPQVSAEERLFLDLSLDFLGEYQLPSDTTFEDTPVRGLSALAYDRQGDRFYALSDDRSEFAPARFYTLKLNLDGEGGEGAIAGVEIENVTTLLGENGEPFATGTIDPEGLALSPRQTVFISTEGVASEGIPPFIDEFDLATGEWQQRLPIPERYVPKTVEGQPQGVQNNLGFEALTLNPGGFSTTWLEPFRLFAATESALEQDRQPTSEETADTQPVYSRFLHYLIGDELPVLIAEYLYPNDVPPLLTVNGLTELVVLDQGGHFLSLERSFGIAGAGARIFEIATGGATDTSGIPKLNGLGGIEPIRKRLLLDLADLNIPLDNLEGMTLGPQLPDGTQSLLLVSDDNFNPDQFTQFLLFRLGGMRRGA
ncbi:MAG: esterase-like activity of phytase family protein [Leptolyngbyaceae cyanobacterium SL_5_14]|nr:esterase-like activity of phytase family protein [Leptolyngbyaceae cyanobacterium SL_5_14]NJO67401.1 esterase-like activity of phytase family protein [Leptolyngbyaceae cyanobacterium RM1_405_57]